MMSAMLDAGIPRNGRTVAAVLAGGGVLAGALWWRRHPSACPYSQRFWVEAPHPFITRGRLLAALEPVPGESVLEIGPGTGYYSLAVARRLAPVGTLHVLDLRQVVFVRIAGAPHTIGFSNP